MRWIRRHPIATILLVLAGLLLVAAYSSEPAGGNGLLLLYVLIGLVCWPIFWVRGKLRKRRIGHTVTAAATGSAPEIPSRIRASERIAPPVLAENRPWPPSQPPFSAHHERRPPSLGDVLSLTPGEFEDLTVRLLESLGYTDVRRSGGAGDLGADVVAQDREGRRTVVQCKRFAPGSTLGSPIVQTFIGMVHRHHQAGRGIIVTTVPYTEPATQLAQSQGIALVDGTDLLLLLDLLDVRVSALPTRSTVHHHDGTCPSCGTRISDDAWFCPHCGAGLSEHQVRA
jgi:hypothetical protein